MRLGRATMLAAVVWVPGLAGQLVGQDEFLDKYRAAVRLLQDREATARARAQAFDRALSAFLRISEAAWSLLWLCAAARGCGCACTCLGMLKCARGNTACVCFVCVCLCMCVCVCACRQV